MSEVFIDRRAMAGHLRNRVSGLHAICMREYLGTPLEEDCEHIAKQLVHRYAQAEWLRDNGLMREEVFATFRYRIDDADLRLAKERLASRKAWAKGKKFPGMAAAFLAAGIRLPEE